MADSDSRRCVLSARLLVFLLAACLAGPGLVGCKSKDSKSPQDQPATQEATYPADGSPPRLTLDRQFIDAGVLGHRTTHDETVTIRNTGGSELVIQKAMIGCRCLQASFGRKNLPPGESAPMTVKVVTLDHWGDVSEKLAVVSNDPAGPKVLTVRFNVARDLAAVPERLYLGFAKPGQTVTKSVKIVANKKNVDTKVVYAIPSGSQSLVGRVVQPVLTNAKPAVLEVEMKAPAKPGTYRGSLSITTGHSAQPTVRLPVVLCVSDAVSVSPDRLDFGRVVRGENVTRTLKVKIAPGTKLKSAVVHPKVLDIKPGPADAEGIVLVHLSIKKDAPYGAIRGELRLELTGQKNCTLTVPFIGYVASENASQ